MLHDESTKSPLGTRNLLLLLDLDLLLYLGVNFFLLGGVTDGLRAVLLVLGSLTSILDILLRLRFGRKNGSLSIDSDVEEFVFNGTVLPLDMRHPRSGCHAAGDA